MNVADPRASSPVPSPAGDAKVAIATHDLTKRFGRTAALSGLTMTVREGEVFGFLGPNGAGKTTAVKLLLGLTRPTSGSGELLGAPLGDRDARRQVGYLPELFRYQGWMHAREVLELHCELARVESDRWTAEASAALELVGLADRAEDKVETFSKGMQQRLGLGVALLGEPRLVLLDEPTSALDPVGRLDVRRIIGRLREQGVTVFLNSHLLTEVERVCDRVAIVDRGRVVSEVGMDELLVERTVRIRVVGLGAADRAVAGRYGRATDDGQWLDVVGVDEQSIPVLVDELVRRGGRIHAVVPGHRSLEDRFLDLLGHEEREPGAAPPASQGQPGDASSPRGERDA